MSHKIVRLEQTNLKKSADYEGLVIPLLLYSMIYTSPERNSHTHFQCIYFNYESNHLLQIIRLTPHHNIFSIS